MSLGTITTVSVFLTTSVSLTSGLASPALGAAIVTVVEDFDLAIVEFFVMLLVDEEKSSVPKEKFNFPAPPVSVKKVTLS